MTSETLPHQKPFSMRTILTPVARAIGVLILFTLFATESRSQHIFGSSAIGQAERGGTGDTIFVPPGMSFTSSYYLWVVSGGTVTTDFDLATPTSWIDSLYAPAGQTSTDCGDPFPIVARITAPMLPGIYTTQVVDINGLWPGWSYILKVADIPSHFDNVIADTLFVGQLDQVPATADGTTGVTTAGCIALPYYPTGDITYEYVYHPAASWISVAPDSLVVPAGTVSFPTTTVQSAVAGSFTTYRYRSQSWYGRPQVIRYDATFLLNTSVHEPGRATAMRLYPNPASDRLNVDVPLDVTFQAGLPASAIDAMGRRIALAWLDRATLDIDGLAPGTYTLELGDGEHRSLARFVKY